MLSPVNFAGVEPLHIKKSSYIFAKDQGFAASLSAADTAAPSDATPPVAKAGKAVKAEEVLPPPGDKNPLNPSLFNRMLKLFQAGDKRADIDRNGMLNINDFTAFLNLYAAGQNPFNQPPPATVADNADADKPLLDILS
jgi:hypothetical protein